MIGGDSKVSVGMSEWLVISLTEKRKARGGTRGGTCHGKQESIDNEISFGHV